MKTPQIYISRNYVEFGPFEGPEIAAFHARGIVTAEDHIHVVGSDTWIAAQDWLAQNAAPKAAKATTAKPKPAKPAAKKVAAPKKKEKAAA